MTTDSEDRMDPLEALQMICVLVEASGDLTEGTPVASTYREIRAVLDEALGPKGRRAPKANGW